MNGPPVHYCPDCDCYPCACEDDDAMTPADKPEPVAWMYERKPEEWPPAAPVVQLTRWAEDDLARPFWTETPLYTRPASDLAEQQAAQVTAALWPILGGDALGDTWHEIGDAILAALKEENSHD